MYSSHGHGRGRGNKGKGIAHLNDEESHKKVRTDQLQPSFYSLECKDSYKLFFSKCVIIYEQFINLDVLKEFDLEVEFDHRGWTPLTRLRDTSHKEATRLFYANMHSRDVEELTIITEVYGQR